MKWVRMLLIIVSIVVGIFIAASLYLYFVQDSMVFYPTRPLEATPDQVGLDYEDFRIPVDSGKSLHAWYLPASEDTTAPVVLFCHGNGGNISHRLETLEFLRELGAAVLLFDYRGYGQSDGHPSETNMYHDVDACYDWLHTAKGIVPQRIVIFGRSLGGAVAIDLAARKPCRGLIVESSFTSTSAMGKRMFPFFPIDLLLKYRFDSIEKIDRIECPLLVTHSPDDDMIPYEMGKALFAKAREPKSWVDLEGSHNNRDYMGRKDYREAVERVLRGKPEGLAPDRNSGAK